MSGLTGLPFNWGDSQSIGEGLNPAMFWFASKTNDASLLWIEKDHFDTDDFSRHTANRILPAALI